MARPFKTLCDCARAGVVFNRTVEVMDYCVFQELNLVSATLLISLFSFTDQVENLGFSLKIMYVFYAVSNFAIFRYSLR